MLKQIQAGDTFEYVVKYSKYSPAQGWSCHMLLRGASACTIESTVVADRFVIKAPADETSSFQAGDYKYFIYVEKDGERYLIEDGQVRVLQDYSDETFDIRSQAKRILDAIDATLEKRATKDQASYKIAGREIQKIQIQELLALRSKFQKEVEAEERAERLAKGLGVDNIVKIRY